MGKLKDLLDQKAILILDGALGTELERRGFDVSGQLWSAKYLLKQPEIIQNIHKEYIKAGSDLITTASYQASFSGLLEAGLDSKEAGEMISSAVTIAKKAIVETWAEIEEPEKNARIYPLVGASVGPYAAYLADGSEYTGAYQVIDKNLYDFHGKRLQILVESGTDFLAIETIPNVLETKVLLAILKKYPQVDVCMSFTSQDGKTISDGTLIEYLVRLCENEQNVVALGINCTAPQHIEPLLKKMRKISKKPFVVYPNSGEIYDIHQQDWRDNPEENLTMTDYAQIWKKYGVQIFGGCCRTRPDDIAALHRWRNSL